MDFDGIWAAFRLDLFRPIDLWAGLRAPSKEHYSIDNVALETHGNFVVVVVTVESIQYLQYILLALTISFWYNFSFILLFFY